ncbi:MAG: hypothetical protein K1X55_17770 [Chitinophagales bacterium]|nr:hypothetical protein [Chitinophagales bacterium]
MKNRFFSYKVIVSASLIFALFAFTQLEVLEKVHEISRKAKKGYLGGIENHADNQQFDMIYVLPSSAKKVILETYTFDKDLNLINEKKTEEEIELVRTRYKWFNFRGDEYSKYSLTASTTLGSKLVFRKKLITYKYSWWYGRYNKSIKSLEKVKPTGESGEKYIFRGGAYEVERDENVLVFAGVQQAKNDFVGSTMHYELIKCDKDVNITVIEKIDFDNPQQIIFSEPLQDEEALTNDENPRDWVTIFAPMGGSTVKGAKLSPKTNQYTFVRVSPEGKIKERYSFIAPSNGWRVLQAYEKEGGVYLYGPSITKDVGEKYINQVYKTGLVATTSADAEEKAENNNNGGGGMFGGFKTMANTFSGNQDMGTTQEDIDMMLDELKFTGFTIAKLVNGSAIFATETPIADFNAKSVTPVGQKKALDFDGKRFRTYNIYLAKNGDILINGQDYKIAKSVIGNSANDGSRLYRGTYLFQFDMGGHLKHNYGVQLDQKDTDGFFNKSPLTADMFPAEGNIFESPDGKQVYWFLHTCRAIHDASDVDYGFFNTTVTESWSPLYTFQYGTLDLEKGFSGEFKVLGDGEKKNYYLFPSNYFTQLDKYLILLSETEKGERLLLSRVNLNQ